MTFLFIILQVLSHTKLGQSKDEFLRLNAHDIASSSHAIFLFTSKGCCSPFTFYEVVFSIWLGKPLIVAVFENCFDTTRRTLSAILSEFPTIDFATALYLDGLDLLLNEIKPQRAMSGVVFEQRYLKQVAEGVCQFKEIADRIQGTWISINPLLVFLCLVSLLSFLAIMLTLVFCSFASLFVA